MKLLNYKALAALFVLLLTTSIVSDASVLSFKKDADGITLALDKGLMKVKICTDNVVEVKYTIHPTFPSKESLVINNQWKTTPKFTVSETTGEIVISTSKLKIKVNKATNSVSYIDLKNGVILSETNANGKSMAETSKKLKIADHTAKSHVRNMLDKLALHTRLKQAVTARRQGPIEKGVVRE